MKKPLLTELQRNVLLEGNSFQASTMRLQLALKHLERTISESDLAITMKKAVDAMAKLLPDKPH